MYEYKMLYLDLPLTNLLDILKTDLLMVLRLTMPSFYFMFKSSLEHTATNFLPYRINNTNDMSHYDVILNVTLSTNLHMSR